MLQKKPQLCLLLNLRVDDMERHRWDPTEQAESMNQLAYERFLLRKTKEFGNCLSDASAFYLGLQLTGQKRQPGLWPRVKRAVSGSAGLLTNRRFLDSSRIAECFLQGLLSPLGNRRQNPSTGDTLCIL